jgi:ABC-type Zn uptake system ZnuABC Zn-binding protein ZnuA
MFIALASALALAFLSPGAPAGAAGKKLKVVASLPDFASIARSVCKDHCEVSSIALGVQDPHYLEAKPSYQVRLSQADLLIYNGMELEIGWLPLLVQGSRNPNIIAGAKGELNASSALANILEVPSGELDRSMGDVHPYGNPHYMLDPRNGVPVARLIRDKLKLLDPANAADYDANCAAFETMMNGKIKGWEREAAPLKGAKIVEYHKEWEYLANWLGLDIVGQVEIKPGVPASPQHRAELVNMMRRQNIKILITANWDPGINTAQRVAEETGAAYINLPAATGGEPGIKEYPDLFDHIISELVSATKEK